MHMELPGRAEQLEFLKREEGEAMLREQKTAEAGCPCEGMVETESNRGVRSVAAPETAERNGASILDRILHRDNLNAAYRRVKRNGGAAGVDGMTVVFQPDINVQRRLEKNDQMR
jgi:hypothetical protein